MASSVSLLSFLQGVQRACGLSLPSRCCASWRRRPRATMAPPPRRCRGARPSPQIPLPRTRHPQNGTDCWDCFEQTCILVRRSSRRHPAASCANYHSQFNADTLVKTAQCHHGVAGLGGSWKHGRLHPGRRNRRQQRRRGRRHGRAACAHCGGRAAVPGGIPAVAGGRRRVAACTRRRRLRGRLSPPAQVCSAPVCRLSAVPLTESSVQFAVGCSAVGQLDGAVGPTQPGTIV